MIKVPISGDEFRARTRTLVLNYIEAYGSITEEEMKQLIKLEAERLELLKYIKDIVAEIDQICLSYLKENNPNFLERIQNGSFYEED